MTIIAIAYYHNTVAIIAIRVVNKVGWSDMRYAKLNKRKTMTAPIIIGT